MMPKNPPSWWTAKLEVVDETVDISNLDNRLVGFLHDASELHFDMFDLPLTITSGNDGNHAQDSKHYQWKAVDIRTRDLSLIAQDEFAAAMVPFQAANRVGIFDERFIGQPHWHVECE